MNIVIMVEGETEGAFLPSLRAFLKQHLGEMRMPKLRAHVYQGPVPTGEKLKRVVDALLGGKYPADHVIWLSDVYPGRGLWNTAAEAKAKARLWVGEEGRFHPHVALHDFEAWLLPYWERVRELAKTNKRAPGGSPESINHNDPPSKRIGAAYQSGESKRRYIKPRDAVAILKGQDLMVAIRACPELKALVNTILKLCGGEQIA